MAYKIHSRMENNLMPFKIFKSLFPKATIESLFTTKTTQ